MARRWRGPPDTDADGGGAGGTAETRRKGGPPAPPPVRRGPRGRRKGGGPEAGSKGDGGEGVEAGGGKDGDVVVYRFDKGFFKALLLMALLTFVLFIPVMGPFLLFSVVPYTAGYYGGRHVLKKDGLLIGVLVGFIWSLAQFYIIFFVVLRQFGLIGQVDFSGTYEMLLIFAAFFANTFFCGLGGWRGGEYLG